MTEYVSYVARCLVRGAHELALAEEQARKARFLKEDISVAYQPGLLKFDVSESTGATTLIGDTDSLKAAFKALSEANLIKKI
jgi:hypothetical protein